MAFPTANPLPDADDARVQGLLQGHSWGFPGAAHQLAYALYSPFGATWGANAASALDQAFAAWAAVADLKFVNVTAGGTFNSALADLPVSLVGPALGAIGGGAVAAMGLMPDTLWIQSSSEFWGALAGYGIFPANYPHPEGDIFINERSSAFRYLNPGSMGLQVFLHEIGHALGLKHPHDDGGAGRPTFSELGMADFDDGLWTLMSYDSPFGGSPAVPAAAGFQVTPMPLDILAIQHLYGANMAYHAGNDTYVLRSDGVVRTLWDAGGVDTLDLRFLAAPYQGVSILLASEGGWGVRTGPLSATYIAFNVRLENLFGTAGADDFLGNEADNWLDGGAGADTLDGGAGNDTYGVDRADDRVLEDSEGIDTIRSTVSWVLSPDIEHLVLLGGASINGTGNAAANRITGNGAANILDGGGGADTLEGGAGNDTYLISDADAQILEGPSGGRDAVRTTVSWSLGDSLEDGLLDEGAADASLTGNGSANALTGNGSANLLSGGAGNDSLDGGGGADLLVGGSGNDSYTLDDAGDVVVEEADGGIDTVFSAVSLLVPAHIENVVLLGSASAILTGSGSDNRLSGGSGADTLDGGGGNDTLAGGGGDDTYLVRDGTTVSESGGGGEDTVVFTGGTGYLLGAGLEKLVLGAGTGTLAGGGGGEDNSLTGNGAANYLDGGAGNDSLYGLGGGDILLGGAGNDLLDGGSGIDRMEGGSGNDTYVVGHSLDLVLEAAGGGIDSVRMHLARYVLPENVENLEGDDGANVLVGNGLANRLTGGGGHDHFVFAQAPNGGAVDTVADFVSGQDHLVLGAGWAGALGGDGLYVGNGTAHLPGDRLLYDGATGNLYYDPDGTGAQAAVRFAVLEGGPAIAWADFSWS